MRCTGRNTNLMGWVMVREERKKHKKQGGQMLKTQFLPGPPIPISMIYFSLKLKLWNVKNLQYINRLLKQTDHVLLIRPPANSITHCLKEVNRTILQPPAVVRSAMCFCKSNMPPETAIESGACLTPHWDSKVMLFITVCKWIYGQE